jgi:hypothetical protein
MKKIQTAITLLLVITMSIIPASQGFAACANIDTSGAGTFRNETAAVYGSQALASPLVGAQIYPEGIAQTARVRIIRAIPHRSHFAAFRKFSAVAWLTGWLQFGLLSTTMADVLRTGTISHHPLWLAPLIGIMGFMGIIFRRQAPRPMTPMLASRYILYQYLANKVFLQAEQHAKATQRSDGAHPSSLLWTLLAADPTGRLISKRWWSSFDAIREPINVGTDDDRITASATLPLLAITAPTSFALNRAMPLFLFILGYENTPAQQALVYGLSQLPDKLVSNGVSGEDLQNQLTILLGMFEETVNTVKGSNLVRLAGALSSLINIFILVERSGGKMQGRTWNRILNLVENVMNRSDEPAAREAGTRALSTLAEAVPPAGSPSLISKRWGQVNELFTKALGDDDPLVRATAAKALGTYAESWTGMPPKAGPRDAFITMMIFFTRTVFDDPDPAVRAAGAAGLGNLAKYFAVADPTEGMWDSIWIGHYLRAMADTAQTVRIATISGLGNLASAISGLKDGENILGSLWWRWGYYPAIQENDLNIQSAAAGTLDATARAFNGKELSINSIREFILPAFDEAARHPHPAVKAGAANGLSSLMTLLVEKDPSGILVDAQWPALVRPMLENENLVVRKAMARNWVGLSEVLLILDPSGQRLMDEVPGFEKLFEGTKEEGRAASAARLGEFAEMLNRLDPTGNHFPRQWEWLRGRFYYCLYDGSEHVRREAAKQMGTYGKALLSVDPSGNRLLSEWLPLCDHALGDKSQNVSMKAIASLGEVTRESDPKMQDPEPETLWHSLDQMSVVLGTNVFPTACAELAILTLSQGTPTKLRKASTAWPMAVDLLTTIPEPSMLPSKLGEELTATAVRALQRHGEKLKPAVISQAYKTYFHTTVLPKGRHGPKDLLAHIVLDFELKRLGLSSDLTIFLREERSSPSNAELMPLISRLAENDALFVEAVRGYSLQKPTDLFYTREEQTVYWQSVEKILLTAARDAAAYEALHIEHRLRPILTGYKASSDELSRAGGIIHFMYLNTFTTWAPPSSSSAVVSGGSIISI